MAMTVRYTTINGEIVAEKRGGERRVYVPDPLGNTVALLDTNQAKTDMFSYWPYGEERVHTGSTPTPLRFGSHRSMRRDNDQRLHSPIGGYRPQVGRWMSTGRPMRAKLPAESYLFARAAPTRDLAAASLRIHPGCTPEQSAELDAAISALCNLIPQDLSYVCVWECIRNCQKFRFTDASAGRRLACLRAWCKNPKVECKANCQDKTRCAEPSASGTPNCRVGFCPPFWSNPNCREGLGAPPRGALFYLIHELQHCCGLTAVRNTPQHGSADEIADCLIQRCLGLQLNPGVTGAGHRVVPYPEASP